MMFSFLSLFKHIFLSTLQESRSILKYVARIFSLPWSQDHPLGYAGTMFFEIMVCLAYLTYVGVFLLLFISLCLIHRAFYRKFRHLMRKFDEDPEHKVEKLCDVIRFHNTAKE